MLEDYKATLKPELIRPEDRMIRLELRHAMAAIDRAFRLAAGSDIEADLGNLLEAAHELLKELERDNI